MNRAGAAHEAPQKPRLILCWKRLQKMAQRIELDRQTLIDHILMMKKTQPDYARSRMLQLHADWPELDLLAGIKQALEQK